MNKDDDKWIKELHDRMEDYSAPLPDGLWEQLEGELSQPQVKVVPFWRRWQSVAAAIAVLAVSSLAVFNWLLPALDNEEMQNSNQLAEQLVENQAELMPVAQNDADEVKGSSEDNESSEKALSEEKLVPVLRAVSADSKVLAKAGNQPETLLASESDIQSEAAVAVVSSDEENGLADPINQVNDAADEEKDSVNPNKEEVAVMDAPTNPSEQRNDYSSYRSARTYSPYASTGYHARKSKKTSDSRFQVGLVAGGMPYSSSEQYQGMGRFASRYTSTSRGNVLVTNMGERMTAYNRILFNNRNADSKTAIKHRMPVNVAATVKWHFTENWALETGLSYTYLQSDLRSGSNLYIEEQQKLHYIGIPVKIHRNIWKNSLLSLYASAGGMIEKCVSGKLESVYVTGDAQQEKESTSLSVDPLQCSLSAALGAQVNFTSFLSLFVEPGAAYYFDDNSNVETIRKEHPFYFNLQFGLRFDLSK